MIKPIKNPFWWFLGTGALHGQMARELWGEVAGHLGVSQAQLSRIESGKSRMSAFQLFKLAEVLSVSLSEVEIKGLTEGDR